MKQAVQITLLGQPFTVRSEASPAEVRKIAAFVNDQVAEIMGSGQTADTLNAAVLALMNMSGAYLRLRDSEQCEQRATSRLQELLVKLETALPDKDKD